MSNLKMVLLGFLGALFLLSGMYYRNISYEYLGLGTWIAGLIYYAFFRKHKEILSLVLGLMVLHSGVILILKETSYQKLLGLLIFTAGIIMVLNSGFSEYMQKRKARK